ncbi:TetR/AcrR family transcriptional regulator [Stigmatella sp. ncwal1]|uniref:TetR/AcrR family transcriptional regulator n=1 Tax=Stigmatella ashevillensis TaxID=2995309 RepID=A0ABT5DKN9_9BACT|nr:TetR/AcrR family transcriptional regulator [Stigmatella ashevillena]MDC0714154.1 TetR/AcrR family transcriptional regulator [Stigmatella ashevillena]
MRRRLVAEGGRLIKERGVQGAGVDGVARAVGLSGAALYSHFKSKQDFLREVLREELGASARRFLAANATWEEAVARYLSLPHVRNAAAGCVLPAVTPDVARSDEAVRHAFGEGLAEVVRALGEKTGRHDEALGVVAAALGAVALARALPDDESAKQVLDSTRALITAAMKVHAPAPE